MLFEDSVFNVSLYKYFSHTRKRKNNSRLTEPQALVTPPSGSRLSGGLTESHPLANRLDTCHNEQPPAPFHRSSGCALPGPAHQSDYRSWCPEISVPAGSASSLSNHLQRPHRRQATSTALRGVVSEQWAVAYRDVCKEGHLQESHGSSLSG